MNCGLRKDFHMVDGVVACDTGTMTKQLRLRKDRAGRGRDAGGSVTLGRAKDSTNQLAVYWSNSGSVHVIQDDGIRDEVHDLLLVWDGGGSTSVEIQLMTPLQPVAFGEDNTK